MKARTRPAAPAVSIALIAMATPVIAQEAQPEDAGMIADVIVTARRSEERLQDVPISITVFNQEQLDRQNVFSARDLATYTPSLSANSRFGSDYASFSIRGFTQEARTTASVGVYFADVVTPRSAVTSSAGDGAGPGLMFDLQNVQVLKGPQGTLFGRNTTGGAVLLVPNRPSDEFEGHAEASIGNYDMRRVQTVVNLPVSDAVRFRAGFDWQERDGYLKNVSGVGPGHFANIDYAAGRLSMLVDITPELENYTVANYSRSTPNGQIPKVTDCFGGQDRGFLTCQQIASESDQGRYAVSNWIPDAFQSLTTWQAINTTTWRASDNLTLKNIVSYGGSVQKESIDLNGIGNRVGERIVLANRELVAGVDYPLNMVGAYVGHTGVASAPGTNSGKSNSLTEELQLLGVAAGGRLNWQAGAYFERTWPDGYNGTLAQGGVVCDDLTQLQGFNCTDFALALGLPRAYGFRSYNVGQVDYRNTALYGQASFKLVEQLTLDAGVRYTWDKSWGAARQVNVAYLAATGWNTPTFACANPDLTFTGDFASCTDSGSQSSEAPTWMIGLNFEPTRDLMLYAKYSRGYRQGAYNPVAAFGFSEYKPEKVDVFEGGLKSTFSGALSGTFNVTGFYNDFRDMQLQVAFVDINTLPPFLAASPAIVNAGKAKIYGVEVEASLNLYEGLIVSAGYSYIHSQLEDYTPPSLSSQPPGGYNFIAGGPTEGKQLQYTPDHKLILSASYALPLPEVSGRVTLGASYIYTGEIYYGETVLSGRTDGIFDPGHREYDPTVSPSYSLVNLNLNWDRILGSNIDGQLFVTNAFDKHFFHARSLSGNSGYINRFIGESRMYGARLRFNF